MNDNLSNRLSIIIPHYNNKDILYNCIHSLTNITYKDCEIEVQQQHRHQHHHDNQNCGIAA